VNELGAEDRRDRESRGRPAWTQNQFRCCLWEGTAKARAFMRGSVQRARHFKRSQMISRRLTAQRRELVPKGEIDAIG